MNVQGNSRIRRTLSALAAGAIAAGGMVLGAPSASAGGLEVDLAKAGGPSGNYSYKCLSNARVKACFQPAGDIFFVQDRKKDGQASSVDWILAAGDRKGQCITKLGKGKTGHCNKNLPENRTVILTIYSNGDPKSISLST